jgi:hypothetical protein
MFAESQVAGKICHFLTRIQETIKLSIIAIAKKRLVSKPSEYLLPLSSQFVSRNHTKLLYKTLLSFYNTVCSLKKRPILLWPCGLWGAHNRVVA